MDATGMFILIIVLAVILVGGFVTVWMRDKNRSEAVAEDSGRFEGDPTHRHERGR